MYKVVNSAGELLAAIMTCIQKGVAKACDEAAADVLGYVLSDVYGAYSPSSYDRTRAFGQTDIDVSNQGIKVEGKVTLHGGSHASYGGGGLGDEASALIIMKTGSYDLWGNGGAFTRGRGEWWDSIEQKMGSHLGAYMTF